MIGWRLLAICLALLLTACGSRGSEGDTRELIVSAAASLTAAFTDIAATFEAQTRGVTVTLNFGPSDGLATQIVEAAPVDVFASASPAWMDLVGNEGPGVLARADFARNRLAIAVPADNPASITRVSDLARPGIKLVLAAEGVPAGDYAREILANAGIEAPALTNVVSNEEDVKAVLTKILAGDADAGIVYVTDVGAQLSDRISLVPIPNDLNVIATYPIAVVAGSPRSDLANGFVRLVLGAGQETLAAHGFLPAS